MISPVAISIFGVDIYWYGISYAISFLAAILVANHYIDLYKLPLKKEDIDTLAIYAIVGVVAGGRLGYFLFYEKTIFTMEVFMIRDGGMSFHGGLLGALICSLVGSEIHKINFYLLTDLASLGAPIGLCLGRFANYINDNEIPGKVILGIDHPVVLYEAFFEGLVLFVILNFEYKNNFNSYGKTFSYFLLYYGVLRFILDFLKDQPVIMFGLNTGQTLCLPMIICGLYILFVLKK